MGQAPGPSEQEGHPSYSATPPISTAALSPPKLWAPGDAAQSQFSWEGFLEEEQVGPGQAGERRLTSGEQMLRPLAPEVG